MRCEKKLGKKIPWRVGNERFLCVCVCLFWDAGEARKMLEFTTSAAGKIAVGVCVGVTVLMSTVLIMRHLMNYTHPILQRYAIRIILMVPVYAVDSYISLWLPDYAFYINAVRDVYEAYVIYNFVAMVR